MRALSIKKMVLMVTSLTLMALTWFVDGAMEDLTIREVVKEELEAKKGGEESD